MAPSQPNPTGPGRPVRPPHPILRALEPLWLPSEVAGFAALAPLLSGRSAGDGRPVLLLPGFCTGGDATGPLRWALRRAGCSLLRFTQVLFSIIQITPIACPAQISPVYRRIMLRRHSSCRLHSTSSLALMPAYSVVGSSGRSDVPGSTK